MITIGAGTYPETVTIPLSVTLVGAGADTTIIDGRQGGTAVTVNVGATATISGVTVQNGSADTNGGGIYNSAVLTLTNSTVSGNNAPNGNSGGIFNAGNNAVIVTSTNTILAGNNAYNGFDCAGSLTSGGYNLVGIGGCGLTNGVDGDQVGTSANPLSPRLGPLQDNGGPTITMAPLPGSPAIDAIAPGNCVLSTDQRGQPRPDEAADSGFCDIGSVEAQEGPPPTNTPSPTATSSPTPIPTSTPTPAPQLAAQPTSGVFGQSVTYSGTSFGPTERVNLYLDSTGNPPFYAVTSTLTGSFVASPQSVLCQNRGRAPCGRLTHTVAGCVPWT
jgi:hypothetical protein